MVNMWKRGIKIGCAIVVYDQCSSLYPDWHLEDLVQISARTPNILTEIFW
jgi:hypothetical protein